MPITWISTAAQQFLFFLPISFLSSTTLAKRWLVSLFFFLCFCHAGRSSGIMIFTLSKRSSSLDFSDGRHAIDHLQQYSDMAMTYNAGPQPNYLQRNKSERTRLQGLQRSNTTRSNTGQAPNQPKTLKQKLGVWMINEGGRQFFFGIWIFLHLLVAVFGMFHYQLKDNLVNARATFGITFCRPSPIWIWVIVDTLSRSDRPCCSFGLARGCHLHPSSCLP